MNNDFIKEHINNIVSSLNSLLQFDYVVVVNPNLTDSETGYSISVVPKNDYNTDFDFS